MHTICQDCHKPLGSNQECETCMDWDYENRGEYPINLDDDTVKRIYAILKPN